MRIVVIFRDGGSWISWAASGESPARALTDGIRRALEARPGETQHRGAWLYLSDE